MDLNELNALIYNCLQRNFISQWEPGENITVCSLNQIRGTGGKHGGVRGGFTPGVIRLGHMMQESFLRVVSPLGSIQKSQIAGHSRGNWSLGF